MQTNYADKHVTCSISCACGLHASIVGSFSLALFCLFSPSGIAGSGDLSILLPVTKQDIDVSPNYRAICKQAWHQQYLHDELQYSRAKAIVCLSFLFHGVSKILQRADLVYASKVIWSTILRSYVQILNHKLLNLMST